MWIGGCLAPALSSELSQQSRGWPALVCFSPHWLRSFTPSPALIGERAPVGQQAPGEGKHLLQKTDKWLVNHTTEQLTYPEQGTWPSNSPGEEISHLGSFPHF